MKNILKENNENLKTILNDVVLGYNMLLNKIKKGGILKSTKISSSKKILRMKLGLNTIELVYNKNTHQIESILEIK